MRLIGILNWYDEKPAALTACVASMVKAGIDHLVAVDGSYALYPNPEPSSDPVQHDVILGICRGAGIGCTLHVPTEPYPGNEVEKRTLGFQLAEEVSDENDWYFLMDADQIILDATGLKEALEETELDVATVCFQEMGVNRIGGFPVRCVFRAL